MSGADGGQDAQPASETELVALAPGDTQAWFQGSAQSAEGALAETKGEDDADDAAALWPPGLTELPAHNDPPEEGDKYNIDLAVKTLLRERNHKDEPYCSPDQFAVLRTAYSGSKYKRVAQLNDPEHRSTENRQLHLDLLLYDAHLANSTQQRELEEWARKRGAHGYFFALAGMLLASSSFLFTRDPGERADLIANSFFVAGIVASLALTVMLTVSSLWSYNDLPVGMQFTGCGVCVTWGIHLAVVLGVAASSAGIVILAVLQ
eukprot:TRINITY_DN5855_c0_g2_i1.p1 TRINITY_DN5855_c0_g2~~TRINITY_DN5855_c0_g2_i1.p1  ORF type:complete len:263 (-),score=74.57 TRINITY_DN5855_c0_g2_i1:80-868(-)